MTAGLILAAGESSRMGRDKALLPFRGRTFLEAIVHTLRTAGIEGIAVVLGHHAEEIQRAARLDKVETVVNPDYQLGQTSSLQAGLKAVVAAMSSSPPSHALGSTLAPAPVVKEIGGGDTAATAPNLDAVVLALVDHPAVSSETIRKLLVSFLTSRASVVIPTYQGQRGHPVLISRTLFAELLALGPHEGANSVIRKHRDETRFVEVDDPGVLLDVDDPETYRLIES
jgi:molybdenum cofactor cytidylyltransferase